MHFKEGVFEVDCSIANFLSNKMKELYTVIISLVLAAVSAAPVNPTPEPAATRALSPRRNCAENIYCTFSVAKQ